MAIFRQPSILRNLICPLATRLKSKISAASERCAQLFVHSRLDRDTDVLVDQPAQREVWWWHPGADRCFTLTLLGFFA